MKRGRQREEVVLLAEQGVDASRCGGGVDAVPRLQDEREGRVAVRHVRLRRHHARCAINMGRSGYKYEAMGGMTPQPHDHNS